MTKKKASIYLLLNWFAIATPEYPLDDPYRVAIATKRIKIPLVQLQFLCIFPPDVYNKTVLIYTQTFII